MVRKNFVLKEKSCEILRTVMDEQNIKTETAALEYVLSEYERREEIVTELFQVLSAELAAKIDRLINIDAACAKNSELLLDCMNTMIVERGYNVCYPADEDPSEVLKQADDYRKKRTAYSKQIKDNRRF